MQFKVGDLVKSKWSLTGSEQVYIVLKDNCGHPNDIGSTRGYAKLSFLYSFGEHDDFIPNKREYFVSRHIMQREWVFCDEEAE